MCRKAWWGVPPEGGGGGDPPNHHSTTQGKNPSEPKEKSCLKYGKAWWRGDQTPPHPPPMGFRWFPYLGVGTGALMICRGGEAWHGGEALNVMPLLNSLVSFGLGFVGGFNIPFPQSSGDLTKGLLKAWVAEIRISLGC